MKRYTGGRNCRTLDRWTVGQLDIIQANLGRTDEVPRVVGVEMKGPGTVEMGQYGWNER